MWKDQKALAIKQNGLMFKRLLLLSLFVSNSLLAAGSHSTVVRAAIEIGTGGPKLQVAEVDPKTNKIVTTLHTQRYFVNFYESIARSQDHQISPEVMAQGVEAFCAAIHKARTFDVDGIVAIATAAFRDAANGKECVEEIEKEVGIKVRIVDQQLEGELAFTAVLAKTDISPQDLIVWDIGGGSIQFVEMTQDGSLHVDCSQEGVGAFNDQMIERIQQRSLSASKSPNPMSKEEILRGLAHACSLSEKVGGALKAKLHAPTTTVVGVGSVFGYGISKMVANKNPFLIEDLQKVIDELAGKTDEDLGGGDFAFCEGTNAILTLGFMQGLEIKKLQIMNVNNTDGALTYRAFWDGS